MDVQVSLNNKSFDRAGITKDCKDAICEYIWNGFEAGASYVSVNLEGSPLAEAMSISVTDNGSGIPFETLNDTFGTFLSSLKNDSSIRIKSQSNKGKGRFSYLSFSHAAKWSTVYACGDGKKGYSIETDSIDRSRFKITDEQNDCLDCDTGTTVTFPLSDAKITDQLSFPNMRQKLLEEFAWYLYLNKERNYSLSYMGTQLDYSQYINTELSKTHIESIGEEVFSINIVVWKNNVSNSSKIYYLTEAGEIVSTQNTSFNKNTVNFYHAVFVTSTWFKPNMFIPSLDDGAQIEIDQNDNTRIVFRQLQKVIKTHVYQVLKLFLTEQADKRLLQMEQRGNFPKFPDDDYGQLRKEDFQRVTRELYCVEPRIFHKLNDTQEKSLLGFLNLLLSSEERESVLHIVEQVVSLTSEQRKSFSEILKRSKLQYIVEAIGIIEKRVFIVETLKKIVFDYVDFSNEREHIQKLIEQHFWLFGEQYNMLTADKNMRIALQEFEKITEPPALEHVTTMSEKEALQRMDIFLYSQQLQDNGSTEMLVVELKAPHVRLTLEVFNQIVRYANTIRKEPRFTSTNRVWRFYAVCAEVDEDVKVKYKNFEHLGKKGLVEIIDNFELYALSWDDVFQAFEARHNFLLSRLKLDYSQVSSDLSSHDEAITTKADVSALTSELIALNAR